MLPQASGRRDRDLIKTLNLKSYKCFCKPHGIARL